VVSITQLPIIFKRTETGSIQQLELIVKNNTFYTVTGKVGGKLITSIPTVVEGKNIGRSNETSPVEQAIKEAQAKWDKKVEKGYSTNIKKIDTCRTYFEPMLAHKYNDYKDNIKFPVLVSPKIDGCRMVAQKNGLWTRNGKPYVSCPHIIELLKPIFDIHPTWVIDGEVYSHDNNFEKIISLVKRTKPTITDLKDSEDMVKLWIFDGLTEYKTMGFWTRFDKIKNEIKNLIPDYKKHIVFVENEIANSHEEVVKAHDKYVSQGYEGVMIRVADSEYENKRSKHLLKLKAFLDDEYEIIDIIEGKGNRSGMAGNLELKMPNGKTFSAGIRGGEDYYKELLKNKNKLIGKNTTIRYQNLSEDGIPRFPIAINIAPIDR